MCWPSHFLAGLARTRLPSPFGGDRHEEDRDYRCSRHCAVLRAGRWTGKRSVQLTRHTSSCVLLHEPSAGLVTTALEDALTHALSGNATPSLSPVGDWTAARSCCSDFGREVAAEFGDVSFSNRPLGSSFFRLSTTTVSMSLTGSRFSSESALRPFHHGIRRQGGTIFHATLLFRRTAGSS
jgi:hypothetical protein